MTVTVNEAATGAATSSAPRSNQRRTATLVTGDDALWPLVGAVLARNVVLKQIDSIDQLLSGGEPDQGGVAIWDARGESDSAAQLARVRQAWPATAIMVLDDAAMVAYWKRLADQRLIASMAPLPVAADSFAGALELAFDEAHMRRGVLGAPGTPTSDEAPPPQRPPLRLIGGVVAGIAVLGGAAAFFMFGSKPAVAPAADSPAASASSPPAAAASPVSGDEQVDTLLLKAAQAVLERRYIEPADSSALALYRNVLSRDPGNAEATQGLTRLAQLLLTKAEAALDQRHFDAALQALETARSIIHDDPRVKALDARVLQMRSELGSSVIQATINAGNYDRAASQIDDAARTKSLTPDQIAQLREDLRRHRDADADRVAKIAQARAQQDRAVQEARLAAQHTQEAQTAAQRQRLVALFNDRVSQGKLTEPDNDSATYYLNSLKAVDPQNAELGAMSRALQDGLAARNAAPQAAKSSAPAQDASLKLLKPINPTYPFAARLSGKEGWVDVAFTVSPDGRVGNLHVADASPPGLFDHAALDAMRAARYEAIPSDQPQLSREAKLRLKFKLQ
ncbi:MAG: TonB family protein [Pseudomonadota bacterium]|nr:TonB family protein [Pseudomonadota bacterium]